MSLMALSIGRSATDRSLWWISEHHDCQLQWLLVLPPFTALPSKAAIPWASSTQATLQSFRGLMSSWSPVMLAFSASKPCEFE